MTQQLGREQRQLVYYSYYMENMTATFRRNIFNFISFIQVVLGSAIMADISSHFFAGLLMTLFSTYIFVYKPGEKASSAKKQARRYEKLINILDTINLNQLNDRLSDYIDQDSDPIHLLTRPAYIKAAIAVGYSHEELEEEINNLTFSERIASFIAGGIPC